MGLVFVTDYEINSLCNYEMKSWGEKNSATENKLHRNFIRKIIVLVFSIS
jgi:hypothetical protein